MLSLKFKTHSSPSVSLSPQSPHPSKHTVEKRALSLPHLILSSPSPPASAQPPLRKRKISYSSQEKNFVVFPTNRKSAGGRAAFLRGGLLIPEKLWKSRPKSPYPPHQILQQLGYSPLPDNPLTFLIHLLPNIPANLISRLDLPVFQSLTPHILKNLDDLFFQNLTSKQVQYLTPEHISLLSTEQICQLFDHKKTHFLSPESFQAISPSIFPQIPVASFEKAHPLTFSHISEEQLQELTPELFQTLSPDVLSILLKQHLPYLSFEQSRLIDPKQILSTPLLSFASWISSEKFSGFSPEQETIFRSKVTTSFLLDTQKQLLNHSPSSLLHLLNEQKDQIKAHKCSALSEEDIEKILLNLEQHEEKCFQLLHLLKRFQSLCQTHPLQESFQKLITPFLPKQLSQSIHDQLSINYALVIDLLEIKIRQSSPQEILQLKPLSEKQLNALIMNDHYLSFSSEQLQALLPLPIHEHLQSTIQLNIPKSLKLFEKTLAEIFSSLNDRLSDDFSDDELNTISEKLNCIKTSVLQFIHCLQPRKFSKPIAEIVYKLTTDSLHPQEIKSLLRTCQEQLSTIRLIVNKISTVDYERDGLDLFTQLGDWGIIKFSDYSELGISHPTLLYSKLNIQGIRELRSMGIRNREEFIAYIQCPEIQEKLRS